MRFDNPRLTRRQVLQLGGAVAASAVIGTYELDQIFPQYSEAVEILLPFASPDLSFASCQALSTPLNYSLPKFLPEDPNNIVLGVGDSIVVGRNGDDKITITGLLAQSVTEAQLGIWKAENIAKPGATSTAALNQLNQPSVTELWQSHQHITAFINVGPDDLAAVLDTPKKEKQLEDILNHPLAHSLKSAMAEFPRLRTVYSAALDVITNLDQFQNNYYALLTMLAGFSQTDKSTAMPTLRIISSFGAKWSIAPRITGPEFNGHVDHFVLDNQFAKGIVERVSAKLNVRQARAIDQFLAAHPNFPITAVNPFHDLDSPDCFDWDQHYSTKGKQKVVDACKQRMLFAGEPIEKAKKLHPPVIYYNPDFTRGLA